MQNRFYGKIVVTSCNFKNNYRINWHSLYIYICKKYISDRLYMLVKYKFYQNHNNLEKRKIVVLFLLAMSNHTSAIECTVDSLNVQLNGEIIKYNLVSQYRPNEVYGIFTQPDIQDVQTCANICANKQICTSFFYDVIGRRCSLKETYGPWTIYNYDIETLTYEQCNTHECGMYAIGNPCVCFPGFYMTRNGLCVPCISGTYKSQVGNMSCSPCTNNSVSLLPRTSEKNCKCNVGYAPTNVFEQCEACEAGKYKSEIGENLCIKCGKGKKSAIIASVSSFDCITCVVHTYSNKYNTKCISCPLNSKSMSHGSSNATDCSCDSGYYGANGGNCTACALGSFTSVSGFMACTKCNSGKYGSVLAAHDSSECKSCPLNSNSEMGSSKCHCNSGYIPNSMLLNSANVLSCNVCEAGKYRNMIQDNCDTCPDNSSSVVASDNKYACQCNEGTSGANGQICRACKKNQYKNKTGNDTCTDCFPNSISPNFSTSQLACTCVAGYYGKDGLACLKCPNYSSSVENTVGIDSCFCDAGFWYNNITKECIKCHFNTVSSVNSQHQTDCICSNGYTGPNGGPCAACATGTYKLINGTGQCQNCPAGTYKNSTGIGICNTCPIFSHSYIASSIITSCTCNVGYSGKNGGICSACPSNSRKERHGAFSCTQHKTISSNIVCLKCV